MRILYYTEEYKSQWDEYIDRSLAGSFYHLTAWKNILVKTFGLKPVYIMSVDINNEINGVLPLFIIRDFIGRRYLISNPSSNYAGICASENDIKAGLYNKAKAVAIETGAVYLELRQLSADFHDLPIINDYVTMVLSLTGNEDYVWEISLKAKTRNQIRKAYREGLKIDSGRKYLDEFYRIISISRRDFGIPNYPKCFFKYILDEFDTSSDILVVKYHNKVIAAMLYVAYKNTFSDPWAASLKEYNRLCPNNILYWEAIKIASEKGFEYFDFGRSTTNSGTYEFKRQWGAEPVHLRYMYFLNKIPQLPVLNPEKHKYQILMNTWKKLPLVITNTLGPRLVKYFPEF